MKRVVVLLAGVVSLLPAMAFAEVCRNCVVYYEPHKVEIEHGHGGHAKALHRRQKTWKKHHRKREHYASHHDYIRARVVAVEPVYRYRAQHTGYESCINHYSDGGTYRSWTPTVLGAVLGGAVGHRLGDSYGDADAAALAGGVLGAAIGRDVGRHHREAGRISVRGPCRVSERGKSHHEPVEYIVTYRYNGQSYRTRMEYHPGEWVELDANKRPI